MVAEELRLPRWFRVVHSGDVNWVILGLQLRRIPSITVLCEYTQMVDCIFPCDIDMDTIMELRRKHKSKGE